MTNQVKKPKAAPVAKKTGYKVVKKEAPVVLSKIYEIPKGGGIVCKVVSEATYYDSEKKQVRGIRYCPSEPSIYKDEQSNQSRREHIIFRDGLLIVPENKPNLQAFLDRHPDNRSNGGSLFLVVDRTKDTEKEVADEFLAHDAIAMVRNKDMDELLSVAVSLGINISQKNLEIRRELLKEAKSKPEAFMGMFDDPRVKCRSAVIQATDFQIIDCKPDGAYWFDSGRLIVSCPAGQDSKDILVRFCLTDKGALVYDEILARLDKLS